MISSRLFAGLFSLISLTILIVSSFSALAVPVLQIRISTDSSVYNVGAKVNIFTNITLDDVTAANLAAIEIDSPYGTPMVIRTVKTGNISQMYFRVQILDLYTSTSSGTPKTLFNPGEIAYANITIKNIDVTQHHVLVGIYIQASDNRSLLAFYPSQDDIDANITIQHLLSMPIPSSASTGQARIFASLFTNFTANSGYAYCPEQTANFSIRSSTPILPQQPEYYRMTFNLPRKECKLGNYTIHAVTNYNVIQTAVDNAQIKVILLGDIYNDNLINMRDISAAILVFNTTPSSPNWNPVADVNNDGTVNMRDISILVQTFQNSAIP
jgi:hypothetical protein